MLCNRLGGFDMASKDLIIDDDFCKEMGTYFVKKGEELDQMVSNYISILKNVRNKGIVSGDVATALSSYISYASRLKKQIGRISSDVNKQINSFLDQVDNADQYLF